MSATTKPAVAPEDPFAGLIGQTEDAPVAQLEQLIYMPATRELQIVAAKLQTAAKIAAAANPFATTRASSEPDLMDTFAEQALAAERQFLDINPFSGIARQFGPSAAAVVIPLAERLFDFDESMIKALPNPFDGI